MYQTLKRSWLATLLLCGSTEAQISIEPGHIDPLEGDTLTIHQVTHQYDGNFYEAGLNAGDPGGPQVMDLSLVPQDATASGEVRLSTTYLPVSDLIISRDFPEADLGFCTSQFDLHTPANSSSTCGAYDRDTFTSYYPEGQVSEPGILEPPILLGNRAESTTEISSELFLFEQSEVDAWGTVQTPAGVYEALRVSTRSVASDNSFSATQHIWFTALHGHLILLAQFDQYVFDTLENPMSVSQVKRLTQLEIGGFRAHGIEAQQTNFSLSAFFENASNDEDLRTMNIALISSGYRDTLSLDGPYTVFAPNDTAFSSYLASRETNLFRNEPELADFTGAHIVRGLLGLRELSARSSVTTLNGSTIRLSGSTELELRVEDARVLKSVSGPNGIVHIVDTVLLPQSSPESATAIEQGSWGQVKLKSVWAVDTGD